MSFAEYGYSCARHGLVMDTDLQVSGRKKGIDLHAWAEDGYAFTNHELMKGIDLQVMG